MKSIDLKDVTILGQLGNRLLSNSMRLESSIYRPEVIFDIESGQWPADWEGRTLLALTRQMEATHREPSYLREILCGVYERLNQKGYMGQVLPDGYFDEQQLSGHNWLLRALLEYYRLTGDEQARNTAVSMINGLYLPLKGAYEKYPQLPEQRVFEGNPDGRLTGACIENWYLSTDIGCAFMCLDSLSVAYRDLHIPELAPLLEEMIAIFSDIDFVGISMQTHAALSGIRGILCYYGATKDGGYLQTAIRLFKLYCREGRTVNYANYNWFNRPSWTEPCAIVDSYMVAMELFRITEDIFYFETAQKIYLNALSHAQRKNGGFGCDHCVTLDNHYLSALDYGADHGEVTDAYWCCTMRGGEGLAEVARSIAMEKDGVLHIGLYNPCEIRYKQGSVEIRTKYPENGRVELLVKGRLPHDKIALFIPAYAGRYTVHVGGDAFKPEIENGFIMVDIRDDCKVALDFDTPIVIDTIGDAESETYHTVCHGFQMLGVSCQEECRLDLGNLKINDRDRVTDGDLMLEPVSKAYQVGMDVMLTHKMQVIFRQKKNINAGSITDIQTAYSSRMHSDKAM